MAVADLEQSLGPEHRARWGALLERFRSLGSVMVAFSGGVDSGLLCAAAWRALGDQMLAVLVKSPVESKDDAAFAETFASQVGFPLRMVDYDDLSDPKFASNPPDRCYICKLARFRILRDLALEMGYEALVEGSNIDDLQDYRPGLRAVVETGVISPLQELGFGKGEIRALSRVLGLSVWDRPSAPCLATRFPYGSPLTQQGLEQVAQGEKFILNLGIKIVRVRHHGNLARIEVPVEEIEKLIALRQQVEEFFKSLGFTYVAVDLTGYRQGSLNEVLK